MLKKFFAFLITVFLFFVYAHGVFAKGEFATSYDVAYSVDDSGVTNVREKISLKNLTDRFYASNFSLTISAVDINEVLAFDSSGPLKTTVKKDQGRTFIDVEFNQQVVGLGKEYIWTLDFSSNDFARRYGKVWEVTIPRMSISEPLDQYNLTLSTPVSFGDPTSITPEPKSFSESRGRLNLNFTKDQVETAGVLANFGSEQFFKFKLEFGLSNNSIVPGYVSVPLPMNTNYQEVEIQKITPLPLDVTIDSDGNFLAWFKLKPSESLKVNVEGLAKLKNSTTEVEVLSSEDLKNLTKDQKYWQSSNPLIKSKLDEIFAGRAPKAREGSFSSNKEKAKLIYDFVVEFLKYDSKRVEKSDFRRLGSLNALASPQLALCSEFTDLFIALARAAGIPAREVVGFAYSENEDLRPKSFGTLLHAWPEYYDLALGWVMVDPTWQKTSGGVDYFNKMDLNHLALAIRGYSSTTPDSTNNVSVKFSEEVFNPEPEIELSIDSKHEIFAGLPASLTVIIKNKGSGIFPSQQSHLSASKISLGSDGNFETPPIPPFGNYSRTFNLRPENLWASFQDVIILRVGNKETQKIIQIVPFFKLRIFGFAIVGVTLLMLVIYFGVFLLHKKTQNLSLNKKS